MPGNAKGPDTLARECCCRATGPRLCSVHWLMRLQASSSTATVFNVGRAYFAKYIKELAAKAGVEHAGRTGTHLLRRGMAQDLMDSTGSLAEVLRAGGWSSSAYLRYLRSTQMEDAAVAQIVLALSDSEVDE